jgi:hypothetical protein
LWKMASLLDLLGQTWPARMARDAWSAAKLPGDVYAGRVDPLSDEGIGRATGLAGLAMGGTPIGAMQGAMGAGPVKRLAMDEASRMARAHEQGFTIDAFKGQNPYHWDSLPEYYGSGRAVPGTENRVPREITEGKSAGFYSSDPDVASRFAGLLNTQGSVFPSKLRMANPLVIDAEGKPAAAFQFENIAREHNTVPELNAFKSAFERGHDGIILKNTADEGTVYVPKEARQVRSKFAAFDPANKDSGFLLGSGPTLRIGYKKY